MSHSQTLVVGIGSPHGDDQAGWLVAERLAGIHDRNGIAVRKAKSAAELLDWLGEKGDRSNLCAAPNGPVRQIGPVPFFDTQRLIICDACRGLGHLGQVRRWTWPSDELVEASWSGTHDLPLPAVLQLAQRLGRLPRHVAVWAVEGAARDALATISPQVASALPSLVESITLEAVADIACTNDRS